MMLNDAGNVPNCMGECPCKQIALLFWRIRSNPKSLFIQGRHVDDISSLYAGNWAPVQKSQWERCENVPGDHAWNVSLDKS